MEEIEIWVFFVLSALPSQGAGRGWDHRAPLENGSYLNSYSVCGLLTISLIIILNSSMLICILLLWHDLNSGRVLINLDGQSKSIIVNVLHIQPPLQYLQFPCQRTHAGFSVPPLPEAKQTALPLNTSSQPSLCRSM